MSEEDLDDWDEECMNILLQVEEKTLSSFSSSSQPLSQTTSLLLRPPESRRTAVEYSPPRELSNRALRDDRELLIPGFKNEHGRVSKQLLNSEQESSKPRKEREAKNEQLNNGSSSTSKEKDEAQRHSKRPNLVTEREDSSDRPEIPRQYKTTSRSKAIGVQTDDGGGSSSQVFLRDGTRACQDLSEKLLDIWDLPSAETLGRNLVSNLLVACETDLHELFGCMDTCLSMKPISGSPSCGSSNGVSLHPLHLSLEASKVSHFYSILTKINNGMERAEALLEPLLDLCALENVAIIHRSLRILNVFLKQLFSLERISGERDNIVVEGLSSVIDSLNSKGAEGLSSAETLYEKQQWKSSVPNSFSRVDWVSLFEAALQIAERETEELVRGEAISVMNIILIRSNAYTDREKFGNTRVFQSIPQMLKKEAGLHVQKQSVQLVYLLLNCPKLLGSFGCGSTEEDSTSLMNIDDDKILCGLVDCMTFSVSGLKELELRRNVIVLLAFLASSGKSGFDILVSHKLPKDTNFLILIMQTLASEIEIEAASLPKSPEIFKERTLLMREALILLNRLVSNPNYSATALQILTKSRDMASLTIDIANRLSRNDDHRNIHFDGVVGIMRKSEVVELARVFKKRVFAYLGNHIT